MTVKKIGKTILILFSSIFYFVSLFSQDLPGEKIYEIVNPSVVVVYAMYDNQQIAQGSGVVLNDSGWVATAYHIFHGGNKIILMKGRRLINDVKIIAGDVEKDILIVQIPKNFLHPLSIGKFELLSPGQQIYAVSSPLGFENTITDGIISALRLYSAEGKQDLIQMTAPIAELGSAGGALVNARGELIGIITQSMSAGQNINFAVPIKDVLNLRVQDYSRPEPLQALDYQWKGKKALQIGKFEDAISYYQKVVELNPDEPKAYINLGIVYRAKKDFNSAIEKFNKAIELNPAYAVPYNQLGLTYRIMGDRSRAMEYFQKAIHADPQFVMAYHNLGILYNDKFNFNAALECFKKVIELEPDYAEGYNSLGNAYENLYKREHAIISYRKAIELNPRNVNAYANLGDALLGDRNYEEAIGVLMKLTELGIKRGLIYYQIGQCYFALEKYEDAINNFQNVAEYKNKMRIEYEERMAWRIIAGSYYYLSLCYEQLSDTEKEITFSEKAFEIFPEWRKMKRKEIMELIK